MNLPEAVPGYPLRTRWGELVPWLSDWLVGWREADRLEREQGAKVDRGQVSLTEMGRALREAQEAATTPEQKAERDQRLAGLVDQLRDRNRVRRRFLEQDPDTARAWHNRHAEDREFDPGAGLDDGQVDSDAAEQPEGCVRNEKIDPITEYLEKVPDPPDKEWS